MYQILFIHVGMAKIKFDTNKKSVEYFYKELFVDMQGLKYLCKYAFKFL